MSVPLLKRVRHNALFFIGSLIILLLMVCVIFSKPLSTHAPLYQDMKSVLKPPSMNNYLGTDYLGRDVFSRIIYGSRISVTVGFLSMLFAMLLGVILGLFAGFYGSWVDNVIMRVTDTMLAFPQIVLALAIVTFLGQSMANVILALSLTNMPRFSRLIRGETLSIMTRDYIRSAKALSAGRSRIMFIHILPNVVHLILVQASLTVAGAIFTEASMSFLGLGVPPPDPSWGGMLQSGYSYLGVAPWFAITPGLAIFLAVMGFNFLGEGIRQYVSGGSR